MSQSFQTLKWAGQQTVSPISKSPLVGPTSRTTQGPEPVTMGGPPEDPDPRARCPDACLNFFRV